MFPGADGITLTNFTCYNCNQPGHLSRNCPEPRRERTPQQSRIYAQVSFNYLQRDDKLSSNWVLLDTCLTAIVCNTADLMHNIRSCSNNEMLEVRTNGGVHLFKKLGTFNLLPLTLHYDKDSMANILAMKDVVTLPGVNVTMDNRV